MQPSSLRLLLVALIWSLCHGLLSTFSLKHLPANRWRRDGLASKMQYDITSNDNGVHTLSFDVGGRRMSFETGKIGRQASGAVIARIEDTMVYSTVCHEREPAALDFTPLRVDFFARYSAVGQTIGAFHRRDSRGDDSEILVARLIDRPIRPMIAEGWMHETQLLAWVLSYDKVHSADPLAICAASAAMCVSAVPLLKPVAGVEVGFVNGTLTVNPTKQEMKNSTLHLTVAGTKDGILMIEGAADFLPEEVMMDALKLGHKVIGEICDAQVAFQKVVGKPKKTDTLRPSSHSLLDAMDEAFGAELTAALSISDKQKRGAAVAVVEKAVGLRYGPAAAAAAVAAVRHRSVGPSSITPIAVEVDGVAYSDVKDADAPLVDLTLRDEEDISAAVVLAEEPSSAGPGTSGEDLSVEDEDEASEISPSSLRALPLRVGASYDAVDVTVNFKKLMVRCLRRKILVSGCRPDGRGVEDMRPLYMETSLLPGAHGSALFTRGETQALATATLGSKAMEAKFETLDELGAKKFYLQYRFPPSSVGEVGRVGGISRREVGHGNLAERALAPTIPDTDVFPYVIRAESLVTESCGSSSMATVCGCCLALLDAGVPIKSSVAGVAMGLILGEKEGDEPVILTDILGLEDALGTMDFKVAGDEVGITTFQLDIKSEGLTIAVLDKALMQARRGRLAILSRMKDVLAAPRPLKESIPKIVEFSVPPETLGKVIGPKGKTVQTLIEVHGLININLSDEGLVQVESLSEERNAGAKAAILKIVEEAMAPKPVRGGRGGRGGDGDKDDDGGEGGPEKEKKEPGPPPEEGMIYRECEIVSLHNFGVFVEVLPGHEGLVHVSELDIKRVETPEKAGFVVGGKMDVKFIGRNDKGQMRLSRRAVLLRDSPVTATGQQKQQQPPQQQQTPAAALPKPNPISKAAEEAFSEGVGIASTAANANSDSDAAVGINEQLIVTAVTDSTKTPKNKQWSTKS